MRYKDRKAFAAELENHDFYDMQMFLPRDNGKCISVKRFIEILNIPDLGQQHSALTDARYEAWIMMRSGIFNSRTMFLRKCTGGKRYRISDINKNCKHKARFENEYPENDSIVRKANLKYGPIMPKQSKPSNHHKRNKHKPKPQT